MITRTEKNRLTVLGILVTQSERPRFACYLGGAKGARVAAPASTDDTVA